MKKTLGTIQSLMKLGKAISILVIIFSVIGMIGALIAGVVFYIEGDLIIETAIGELELGELGEDIEVMLTKESLIYMMVVAFVACLTEIIIASESKKYFKFEIKEGTPFTFEGAKKLKKVGILAIVLPIVMGIVLFAVEVVISALNPEVNLGDTAFTVSIGTGIMMLIFSLIFKHGAELNEVQKKANLEKEDMEKKLQKRSERNQYYY